MSIPIALHHPGHPVWMAAFDQANDIILQWLESGLSHAEATFTERDGVYLAERIAEAILESKGFDLEGLCLTVEDKKPGETDGDAMARFDRDGFDEDWWNELTEPVE